MPSRTRWRLVGLDGDNAEHGKLLINLLAEDHSRAGDDGKHRMVIEAYGYRWYRVGGLDYLLRRTEVDQRFNLSGPSPRGCYSTFFCGGTVRR